MKERLTLLYLNEPSVLIERILTLADAVKPLDRRLRAAIEAHLLGEM